MDFARSVVIDNGTGVLKAGFSGEERPTCQLQNVVGRPKHPSVMPGGLQQDSIACGETVQQLRGVLKLSYPMEHGQVTSWQDMEHVWGHLFTMLDVPIKDHPVLLTEAPLNSRRNREKTAEIFFDKHHVPALFFSVQAVLSLYAAGTTTGCVLDVGDGVTHVCPVFEGFVIPGAVSRSDIAGRDVTAYMQRLLRQSGHNFSTSAGFELVRQMKESQCFVSFAPHAEEKQDMLGQGDLAQYKLPDGSQIHLHSERYRPPEVLFDPQLVDSESPGVTDLMYNSIKKCDLDVRKELLTRLYLSGGSTMFKGFGDRVMRELRAHNREAGIKLHAPPARKYTTWTGGAILANLAAFRKMMITAEQYKDEGARCVHRMSFL